MPPALPLLQGDAGIPESFPAAVERDGLRVTHLPQVVRHERGAEASAAVEDEFGVLAGDLGFDVTLDHALAQMHCAGDMSGGPLVVFASVHEDVGFACL